ncbi:type II toxin-antitoxin system death-on-curing family toxin [Candidatus Nomurabacteria bacterium]|nr:type II toxin-antitoxin system death-on-curing family toxin [Candidatus Nomurabacteria bacterium]
MRYLSVEEIEFIHDQIISEIGGAKGIREPGMLVSISQKPKVDFGGIELYSDVFTKAAALFEGICNYHVFIDGNKRTSAICMYRFLWINGYQLIATNKQLESYTMQIAMRNPDLNKVASWIKKHSRER